MQRYTVLFSDTARSDIDKLSDVILYEYKAPMTAFSYIQGLLDEIKNLKYSAESYAPQTNSSLHQYGPSPRRINYKKMAIIYNVINEVVYIRRVIPANTIANLQIH